MKSLAERLIEIHGLGLKMYPVLNAETVLEVLAPGRRTRNIRWMLISGAAGTGQAP